jgi:hypothetical protein
MKQELLKTKFVDNQTKEKIILTDVSWEEKKMVIINYWSTSFKIQMESSIQGRLLHIPHVKSYLEEWGLCSP